jgi:hypothetical protein
MRLAEGRYWRANFTRGAVALEVRRGSLPEELSELGDFQVAVPLEKWNLVVKRISGDRKLLGGLLLDFAKHKDRVGTAVGSDRLLSELRRVVLDATSVLIEEGALALVPAENQS